MDTAKIITIALETSTRYPRASFTALRARLIATPTAKKMPTKPAVAIRPKTIALVGFALAPIRKET